MSRSRNYDLLAEGKKQEKKYNWITALEPYKKALIVELERNDFYEGAKIYERIGFCYHRAAMQAKNLREFKNRMLQAINAYIQASELLEKVEDPKKQAEICHCKAITTYVNSLLKPDFASRKRSLDECLKLEKEALKFYKRTSDHLSLGKTCSELSMCLVDRLNLEWDKHVRLKMLKEALSYGEKAITALSERGEEYELARAYFTVSIHYNTGASGLELEKKRKYEQKALSYSKKAVELSEKIGDRFLLGMSNISLGSTVAEFTDQPDSATKHFENALQCGIDTRDNYLIGRAFYCLASSTSWKMFVDEDLEKKREESKKCQRYSEDAIRHFSLISNDQEIASSYCWLAENYNILAEFVETSSEKKRVLLKRSIEAGRKGLEHARRSGSIGATWLILHPLGKSLFLLSTMETDADVKKRLLKESLQFIVENIKTLEQAMPYFFWNQGVRAHYLALIQAELARIEENRTLKVKLLENGIESAEKCINLCLRHEILSREQHAVLGGYYFDFGGILSRLYQITGTYELVGRQVKIFEDAIKAYEKAELPSRIAEGHWQLARAHNKLQNYMGSAESFEAASESYKAAAKKLPRLKGFYLDYTRYMQAWSEIEKARHHHARQEHFQAMTHYEKVSSLHKSSKSWKHLAANYLAWVQLEHGEGLSRGEKTQEAIQAFRKAAELFSEAKRTLRDKLERIENADEKNLASKLIKASDTRKAYCIGRVVVEEGKIHDRQGDCIASSKRYKLAAEMFQEIAEAESGQSRKELLPIVYLCQAWQKMMMAEAKASSTLYGEAAELFRTAKEHTIDKQTSLLALANSSFCKALEAGTEFEITRNMAEYSIAKRHLEAASSCYLKSGFKSASEYARATHRLFDAYVYMSRAETETDLRTKAKCYQMAQKLLQASVSSYMKAKYPEKSEEVQRLLESVKEEQQLVMSLTEVLQAPTVASTTSSFTTPTPTHEKAVGLDKFEHAAIEANLSLSSAKATAGENINLEMQITNVGKEAALLTKVEGILPQGFELVARPGYCNLENACLEMKGKKLDPLRTEEVRLILRSFSQGTFAIKPRIIYVNETGSEISCEPEPVVINVSEVTLPGRVETGYKSLDCVLFGGIPENYAVIVTSASCDEKELLIKRFLEAGAKKGQVTFYVTVKASGVNALEELESSLYLFICNPQVDKVIKSLPNVFKLRGVENLTNISIAMTSAFRKLSALPREPRRACIEIISDVLLQHHAVSTRRWLTGFITNLRSKGFTTLAVMNPQMHSPEDVQAILGLFEGQINIYEKDTERGLERFLRVTKMYNQRYLQSELLLKKESM